MTDQHGNTVAVQQLTTDRGVQQVFVARGPHGRLLGRSLGDRRELRTVADLAAAGVDISSSALAAVDSCYQPA